MLAHQDFLSNPPSAQVHITTKEPKIAADMVDRNIMTRDSCVNYADITNQRFYMVGISELALQLAAENINEHIINSRKIICAWNMLYFILKYM